MNFEAIPNEFMVYGTLFALSNRIQTIADGQLSNITTKQHFLLTVLSLFGDNKPNLKEMADVMGCSYQNVKRMADSLENKGYLKVARDKNDKRKYNLIMTNKYTEFSTEIERDIGDFMQQLFKGISQEDLKYTLRTLTTMECNLKECD